jgi:Ca2+-binding RTX toxin-like protein
MPVSRFSLDRASDRASLLQDADAETLALLPAPEDLLSDAERDRIILQPLAERPPSPPGITLIGTPGNDVLRGTDNADRIEGRAGNDRIFGEGSDDVLSGGAGDDRLFGGRRDDFMLGGPGRDRLFGNRGDDQLFGGTGPDELRGEAGDDLLEGGAGRDSLFGGNGNDRLLGQGGSDFLLGGRGNDVIVGGTGRDRMSGGGGSNRFVYNSFADRGDTIVDFDRRRDVLDLSRLFQGDNFASSDKFEDYVIIVREDEEVTIIRVDTDGDRGDEPFKTLVTLENVEFDDVRRSNFVL